MRRGGLVILFLAGCVVAGLVTSGVVASPGTTTTTTTGTTTTAPTTTTTPETIAPGVTVGGVAVGGMTPAAAYSAVLAWWERPVLLRLGAKKLAAAPELLGASVNLRAAIDRAREAGPDTALRVQTTVNRARTRAWVARLASRTDRKPRDAQLFLRKLKPFITKERAGRTLVQGAAVKAIVAVLTTNKRGPVALKSRVQRPRVTRAGYGPVIVIHRGSNRLYLYDGMRLWRIFAVATGQTTYPTPLGRFAIVVKWRNPWWYPPNSPWATGEKPTPPGPSNPLGTRWMGLSAAGVGIHGTPNDASIGYSVSHGCIRMHIPDAEWLFEHVRIGTTVFIVAP